MKKTGNRNPIGLYTIGIVGLFLIGFFMLVIFGARSYQGTVASDSGNREERAILSYISTSIRDNDSRGAVSIRESGYGDLLEIRDGDTGYSLKIYQYEGKLMEDFGKAGAEPDLKNDQVIGDCSSFELDMPRNDIVTVKTEQGKILVNLRSEERSEG